MLKKERHDILSDIKWKLENDLNNVVDFTSAHVDNNEFYACNFNDGKQFSAPYESVGWPPGLFAYIHRLSLMMAYEILNNTHTEKELDQKAEDILLDTQTDSITK